MCVQLRTRTISLAILLGTSLLFSRNGAADQVLRRTDPDGSVHYVIRRDGKPLRPPATPYVRVKKMPVVPPGDESSQGRATPAPEPASSEPTPSPHPPSASPESTALEESPDIKAPAPPMEISARDVTALEAQIKRDQETLKQLISDSDASSAAITQDSRLREIARRLPRLQAELAKRRRAAAH